MSSFDAVSDNLSRLEVFKSYIPAIISIFIFSIWIILIRKSKTPYNYSLGLSLFLFLIAVVTQALTSNNISKILGEYSFMLLGVGIIQIVFTKNNDS